MSKRRLLKLVTDNWVNGWDDPRLPTLNGFRRRGYPASAIKLFCDTIGISRNENFISLALLEFCCRTALEPLATRAMVVMNPVKVVLTNYPDGKTETLQAPNMPKDESKGSHDILFSRVIYLDGSDVSAEDRGKDFFGLAPGKEVHLKYAYNIRADKFVMNPDGSIKHIEATVDLSNKSKPPGKITWVASPSPATDGKPLEVELRLYDILFKSADPMGLGSDEWLKDLNPDSLKVVKAYADPSLKGAKPGQCLSRSLRGLSLCSFFVCDPLPLSFYSLLSFSPLCFLFSTRIPAFAPLAYSKRCSAPLPPASSVGV